MTAKHNSGTNREDSIDDLDQDELEELIEMVQQLRQFHMHAMTVYGDLEHELRSLMG